MRAKVLFWITLAIIAALVWSAAAGGPLWMTISLAVVAAAMMIAVYRAIVLPAKSIQTGFELIRNQDLNNRLAPTHEPVSDSLVELFNTLMEKLKNENLRRREQDHFLNLLIEASPVGIAILNLDGRYSLVNREFADVFGRGGEPLLDSVPSADLADIRPGESKTLRLDAGRIYRVSLQWFMESGFRRYFYMAEPLGDEIRKAERAAYGKVIRTISHEVNNSLGGIISFVDLLKDASFLPEDLADIADSCRDRCDNLTAFIRSYADVVKIPEPAMVDFDLGEELLSLEPFLRMQVPEGIGFAISLPDSPLPVQADPTQLQQVLVNIVKNAVESVKNREEGGFVKIVAEKEGDGVSLSVIDNGPGIPEEVARNLFTPFYSTKPQGSGIGLTLAADILSRHHFPFSLSTNPLSSLTSFRIQFPQ